MGSPSEWSSVLAADESLRIGYADGQREVLNRYTKDGIQSTDSNLAERTRRGCRPQAD